jgi:large exoprotein involved in heme utilization and adhesion
VESEAVGNSGDVQISARNLLVSNGAQILSTVAQGNPQFGLAAGDGIAGDININVKESVREKHQ